MADTLALVDALAAKPLQYLHVSLWDFYKKARRDGNDEYRMKLIHQRINGRLPFIGVGKLYTGRRHRPSLGNGLGGIHRAGKP